VVWRNDKDLADEITVDYPIKDISYSNLIDRIQDRVVLFLDIEENEEVIVRRIEFSGNDSF
jgi:hypothetical protein